MTRQRKQPTSQDIAIWQQAQADLMDMQYTGLSGYFQIAGHHQIEQWTAPFREGIVLEIGCGNGHHLVHRRGEYGHYIGLDVAENLLRIMDERLPAFPKLAGSAYELPFPDASIDCVFSVYVFEHLRELARCLQEVRRVLKSNGELLIGLPTEGGLAWDLGRRLTSKPYMERKYGIDYMAIVHWEHWNTHDEVVAMVKEQFTLLEQRFVPFNWFRSVHGNIIGCLRAVPHG